MSGECDHCGEQALDCICNHNTETRLEGFVLKMALENLSMLGYEPLGKNALKKIKQKGLTHGYLFSE